MLSGKRWVIPKGSLDEGEQSREAAIRETEEEAALIDDVVAVNLMRVTMVLDHWLEPSVRTRRWLPIDKAAPLVATDRLLFVHLVERLFKSGEAHFRGPMIGPLRKGAHA